MKRVGYKFFKKYIKTRRTYFDHYNEMHRMIILVILCLNLLVIGVKFEDTKGVIKSCN